MNTSSSEYKKILNPDKVKPFISYKEKLIGFTLDKGETILFNNTPEAQEIKFLVENNIPFELKQIMKIKRTDIGSSVKLIGYDVIITIIEQKKMEDNETLLKDAVCEQCKWFYTGKSDDGRFYRCENEDTQKFIKKIEPDFGCKYFINNG